MRAGLGQCVSQPLLVAAFPAAEDHPRVYVVIMYGIVGIDGTDPLVMGRARTFWAASPDLQASSTYVRLRCFVERKRRRAEDGRDRWMQGSDWQSPFGFEIGMCMELLCE